MKLHLNHHEAEELVRLIDEEEKIDEEAMQRIKARIVDHSTPAYVRRDDLETVVNMLPVSWVDIHELTSPICAERTTKKGKVKPCLACKLSQQRERSIKRLREALGMPLPIGRS